jgi:hypothetical protein
VHGCMPSWMPMLVHISRLCPGARYVSWPCCRRSETVRKDNVHEAWHERHSWPLIGLPMAVAFERVRAWTELIIIIFDYLLD